MRKKTRTSFIKGQTAGERNYNWKGGNSYTYRKRIGLIDKAIKVKVTLTKACEQCENAFLVDKKLAKQRFCSHSCYWLSKKGCDTSYMHISSSKRTSIERKMSGYLTELGLLFEEQKRIGKYIVDFYLPEYKAVIETMGEYWHFQRPEQIEKDEIKVDWLLSQGYSFFFFPEATIDNKSLIKNELVFDLIKCYKK